MQQSGPYPTTVTFLILMIACSHVGDVEKGQQYFDMMTQGYSFSPEKERLSSYIDLLGRHEFVEEAYESLEKMPNDPGVCAWGSLLAACRLQGYLDVGLATSQKLFELDTLLYYQTCFRKLKDGWMHLLSKGSCDIWELIRATCGLYRKGKKMFY